MNMRDKLLNSALYSFKKINDKWHNNPLFIFEGFTSDPEKKNSYLNENQIYLGLTDDPLIFLNDLKLDESNINPDLLILASRHISKAERPAFLIHTTGNWSDRADFGGNPHDLSQASALLIKAGFLALIEQKEKSSLTNFVLDLEVSHHGPTILEKPLVFMELGSSKKEWSINEAGEVLTTAIIEAVFKYLNYQKEENRQRIGVGFGGPHYAPQFKKTITEKDVAISYICPKYFIQDLNKDLITQMLKKNLEIVEYFILDWKSIKSANKQHLIPLLEEFNLPIKKTKDL